MHVDVHVISVLLDLSKVGICGQHGKSLTYQILKTICPADLAPTLCHRQADRHDKLHINSNDQKYFHG
jgi:hypothetical protein